MPTRRVLLRSLVAAPLLPLVGCTAAGPAVPPRGAVDPRTAPFGAVGNGVADDTQALQGAIDAVARHTGSGAIVLPGGRFRITDTLRVRNARGLRFAGTSPGGTVLSWHGPSDRPLLLLDDTRDSVFTDFAIDIQRPHRLHTGVRCENGPDNLIPPTQNLFQNIHIDGHDHRGLEYGFRIAVGAGGDANNEFHDFIRCHVANYRVGYSIEHSQSHTNRFYSCAFTGNGAGEAGVRTLNGSFYWYGGGGGGNSVADFLLGSPNVIVSIINGNFESSARLLVTAGPTGARWPITLQGVRFSADRLHADGIMIDVQTPGPLILSGNAFGESAGGRMPRVRLRSNVPGMAFVSRGNVWIGNDSLSASPYIFDGGGARAVNASIEADSFVDGSTRDPTVFADGDRTPSIHASRWFRTRNSRRTMIEDFINGWPGAEIVVLVDDDNTVFDFTKKALAGPGRSRWHSRRGDSVRCTCDGERWVCRTARGR